MISEHNKALFEQLRALQLPRGEYAIFGSGPLGIRGLHDCHDLDVIVTQSLYDRYRALGWKEDVVNSGSKYLDNGNGIEFYYDWAPGSWNVTDLIKEAEIIESLPFVQLNHVVEWKKLNGRAKDIEHLSKL